MVINYYWNNMTHTTFVIYQFHQINLTITKRMNYETFVVQLLVK